MLAILARRPCCFVRTNIKNGKKELQMRNFKSEPIPPHPEKQRSEMMTSGIPWGTLHGIANTSEVVDSSPNSKSFLVKYVGGPFPAPLKTSEDFTHRFHDTLQT